MAGAVPAAGVSVAWASASSEAISAVGSARPNAPPRLSKSALRRDMSLLMATSFPVPAHQVWVPAHEQWLNRHSTWRAAPFHSAVATAAQHMRQRLRYSRRGEPASEGPHSAVEMDADAKFDAPTAARGQDGKDDMTYALANADRSSYSTGNLEANAGVRTAHAEAGVRAKSRYRSVRRFGMWR